MSSQVQKSRPRQELFKYHIDRNITNQQQESVYFRRLNRYRYNSYNSNAFHKWARFKYPVLLGLGVSVLWDYTFRRYQPITEEH